MPKILNFVKIIQYYSKLFTGVLNRRGEAGSELDYTIDLARLEAVCADPDVKLLHFCNPHNPVGRCWARD